MRHKYKHTKNETVQTVLNQAAVDLLGFLLATMTVIFKSQLKMLGMYLLENQHLPLYSLSDAQCLPQPPSL